MKNYYFNSELNFDLVMGPKRYCKCDLVQGMVETLK